MAIDPISVHVPGDFEETEMQGDSEATALAAPGLLRLRHQPLRQCLLLVLVERHGLDDLGHSAYFPPSLRSACQAETHPPLIRQTLTGADAAPRPVGGVDASDAEPGPESPASPHSELDEHRGNAKATVATAAVVHVLLLFTSPS